MGTYRIRDLNVNERPRERLARLGPKALRDDELLAILLRVGMAGESAIAMGQRLLSAFGGLRGLHQASFHDLKAQRGLGAAKAAQLQAAFELGRRVVSTATVQRPLIRGPQDVADLLLYEMSGLTQENLRVLVLNTRNQVLDIVDLYRGSLNSAQVRIAEVFKPAILRNAASVIVVHNHPSGDPAPSGDDIALTRSLREAGKLLDIELLDHLIFGGMRYVSLKERKLGF